MKEELKIPRTDREDLYLEHIKHLEEELKKDHLTGLLNYKAFKALNKDLDGSYLFLDIDNIKVLNDEYKDHQLGTAAIKAVGHIIEEYFDDLACRYGGDEFLLFLPLATVNQAELFGNFLLNKVREAKLDPFYRGSNEVPEWNLTCSIGVGSTIEEADRALYQAKYEGRNKVYKGTKMSEDQKTELLDSMRKAVEESRKLTDNNQIFTENEKEQITHAVADTVCKED